MLVRITKVPHPHRYGILWAGEKKLSKKANVVYFLRMKIKLSPLQVQKTILAPSMQQSITVLMLPHLELKIAVDQELQDNPLLEIDEENVEFQTEHWEHQMKLQFERQNKVSDLPNYGLLGDDEAPEEKPLTRELTLEESLLQQLRIEINDPLQIKIGELIIGNIDEDGYLKANCAEIAQLAGIEDISLVDHVLSIVQSFEPLGIASRDLKECLMIQLKSKYNGKGDLPIQIILEHLEDLARRKYLEIARKVGVSLEEARRAAAMICSLDPKPARNYRPIQTNIYIRPDITIKKDSHYGYQIYTNQEEIPTLRINPFYKNILSQPHLKEEEKEFIRERLKNALNFIKSIEQRGETLRAIARYILEKQKDFFEGSEFSILPMTLKDVASSIHRNESTVCRAINNKYIDTPLGLFPLKFFFSQAISYRSQDPAAPAQQPVSGRSIQEQIKEMIHSEDKTHPLSDQKIQNVLSERGLPVARRTITKYRQNLRILPSNLRKT